MALLFCVPRVSWFLRSCSGPSRCIFVLHICWFLNFAMVLWFLSQVSWLFQSYDGLDALFCIKHVVCLSQVSWFLQSRNAPVVSVWLKHVGPFNLAMLMLFCLPRVSWLLQSCNDPVVFFVSSMLVPPISQYSSRSIRLCPTCWFFQFYNGRVVLLFSSKLILSIVIVIDLFLTFVSNTLVPLILLRCCLFVFSILVPLILPSWW